MTGLALQPIREWPDWLPPTMVKELRQGRRSAIYRWSFALLLAAAGVHGMWALGEGLESAASMREQARDFLRVLFLWLSLGCVVILPAVAYLRATGAEVGDMFEHLMLAGLDPACLTLGRFGAAGARLAMLALSFAPLVVLSQGFADLDPIAVAYLWVALPLLGWVCSAVALAWTLVFPRGLAVAFGLGLLALGLLVLNSLCSTMSGWLIDDPQQLYTSNFVAANVVGAMLGCYAAFLGLGLASSHGWDRD